MQRSGTWYPALSPLIMLILHSFLRLSLTVAFPIGRVCALEPTEIYTGGYDLGASAPVLKIANGGAGQSGLVRGRRFFANDFFSSLMPIQSLQTPSYRRVWKMGKHLSALDGF